MKFRFTLRQLLIVLAVLALAVYWRGRPAETVNAFASAINSQSLDKAQDMLVASSDAYHLIGMSRHAKKLNLLVRFDDPTLRDWLTGRRRGHFVTNATFDSYELAQEGTVTATATGVAIDVLSESRNDLPTLTETISAWLLTSLNH